MFLSSKKSIAFNEAIISGIVRCSGCGVCHSVCPVYTLTREETFSARGRIKILQSLFNGELKPAKAGKGIFDRCLLCYACATACPSGVKTDEMWIWARNLYSDALGSGTKGWALKSVSGTKSFRGYLKLAGVFQRLYAKIVPERKGFQPLLSPRFLLDDLPALVKARGEKKYRVGYFVGCVSNFFLGQIGLSAIKVLSELGCEVVIPREQVCCGAPAFNNGEMQTARMLALKNVKAFLNAGVDIITSADATCGGSFVHEYRLLLNDDPGYLEFAQKYREIHKLILELGLPEKLKRKSEKISYHDSCHLRHTQGIAEEPRKILKSLPGLELPEMAEADICCGFGGSFSVFHAPDSSEISGKKLENALAVGADGIACGSPGCILKLREEVVRRRLPLKVKHTVEFIRERLEID